MTKRVNYWVGLGLSIAATLILTLLSPAESTLGNLAKLVYLHGAVAAVALLMFATTALLALTYLVSGRRNLGRWSSAVAKTAITFWLVYLATSLYVAWAAWGGILWNEPLLQAAIKVLFICALAIFLYNVLKNERVIGAINLLLGGGVGTLRLMAGRIFHPLNPVGSSGDTQIILFFFGMTLSLIPAAIITTILWLTSENQTEKAV